MMSVVYLSEQGHENGKTQRQLYEALKVAVQLTLLSLYGGDLNGLASGTNCIQTKI